MPLLLLTLLCLAAAEDLILRDCSSEAIEGFCMLKSCPWGLHFTQGLEVLSDDKHIAVSSGWYGQSRVNIFSMDWDNCKFKQTFEEKTDPNYFAEGLTRVGDKLLQFTWREKRIIVWKIVGKDKNKLEHEINKTFPRFNKIIQGWGAASQKTENRTLVWVADSSHILKAFDPKTWKHVTELPCKMLNGTQANHMNEMEIINEHKDLPEGISNYVFFNTFFDKKIFMLDLRTGQVVKEWDFGFIEDHQKEFVKDKLETLKENLGSELT